MHRIAVANCPTKASAIHRLRAYPAFCWEHRGTLGDHEIHRIADESDIARVVAKSGQVGRDALEDPIGDRRLASGDCLPGDRRVYSSFQRSNRSLALSSRNQETATRMASPATTVTTLNLNACGRA
jgi:hypothetical protein